MAENPADSDPRQSIRQRVFVIGAGIMGSGIAAQCALAGYAVTLEDVSDELVQRGRANLQRALDAGVAKGRIPASDSSDALANIDLAIGLRRLDSADWVIEAAPENLALKRQLFRDIELASKPGALLATNTSSLPITSIASTMKEPERLVGIHFFNPVLQMPLVEIIPGVRSRADFVDAAKAFALSLGKTVVTSKDSPGFVTTRALAVLGNEAVWMLYEGIATREDIDTAYKLGFHHPMGPLELLDLVGLDTALAILDVLWDGFRDPKYRPCPMLRSMVEAGQIGRKSGQGFYSYPPSVGGSGPAPT
ncbi:MAG: 3-hydroxyacyl-CoA dehydrogenase NAD-binding domain-containing protein [Thermoplasmata archaeon]